MNVLIPMAGRGSRFAAAGYDVPKPFIDVDGRPMIEVVVDALGVEGTYYFLCLREHLERFPARLGRAFPVEGVTEGAACTVLLAREYIDTDEPLLIANSDQWIRWDPAGFFTGDGAILTFPASGPKWSYARLRGDRVVEVAEKRQISRHATAGVYYFARGRDFVRAADAMIAADRRTNGEFYIAPVYNELIAEGLRITAYPVVEMRSLGTPEDLDAFRQERRAAG